MMMYKDDESFIIEVSPRLEKFSRQSTGTYVFRCPFCGDSAKDPNKTRGNLFPVSDGRFMYRCFNCDHTANLKGFLDFVDPVVAKEYTLNHYVRENKSSEFGSRAKIHRQSKENTNVLFETPSTDKFEGLKRVSELHDSHPARKYLSRRLFPLEKAFYSHEPDVWLKKKTSSVQLSTKQPKLIFPMVNQRGRIFGAVFRSFLPDEKMRYQTVKFSEVDVKCWGLDYINYDKEKFVVEGIMDAAMLPNAIASLDASLHTSASKLGLDKSSTVLIFDNEPRNKFVVRNMMRALEDGWTLGFWPKSIDAKDINEARAKEINLNQVTENRYSGVKGLLTLSNWKGV